MVQRRLRGVSTSSNQYVPSDRVGVVDYLLRSIFLFENLNEIGPGSKVVLVFRISRRVRVAR